MISVVPLQTRVGYELTRSLGRLATPYEIREEMVRRYPELERQLSRVPREAFYDKYRRLCVRYGNRGYVIDNSPWWIGPWEFDIEEDTSCN
jgi:hypothetical protein